MAIDNFIPEIWSARFQRHLDDNYIWNNFTLREYEGEIRNQGDVVQIPNFTKSFTIGDYTPGTDIAAPEDVDGGTIELPINKKKYFNFRVDDVNELQTAPNLMDEALQRANVNMVAQLDADAKAEFETAVAAARRITVAGTLEANGFGTKFLEGVSKAKRAMSVAKLPLENRWMIIHPDTVFGLEQYFLTKPPANIFVPASTEQTLRAGFMGKLLGFDTYVTNIARSIEDSGTNYWEVMCGQGNFAVAYASQIAKIEAYRLEKQFSDGIKGLFVYGHKAIEPQQIFVLRHAQAA